MLDSADLEMDMAHPVLKELSLVGGLTYVLQDLQLKEKRAEWVR